MDDEKFFKFSRNVFQVFGLWSRNHEKNHTIRARFIRYSVVSLIGGIVPILSASDVIAAAQTESFSSALIKALYGFAFLMCFHKVFAAGHNSDEIFSCIRKLEMIAHKFQDLTDFKACLRGYSKMTKLDSASVNLGIVSYMAAPLLAREFAYNPHLPNLDFTKSPNYELMYIYQTVAVAAVGNVMIAYDTIFCGLMYLCCGVLSSIRREVRQLNVGGDNQKATEDALKEIIEKIIETSNIITQISDIFSLTTMTSILYNCILMAFGLFIVSYLPLNDLSCIAMIFVIIFVTFQMWIYCYFGQMVVNEKQLLQTELYCTNWYNGSKNFKTMIFLTIFEAQKDRYIKAGNILPLSLDTLTAVLKKAYAFYAFFKRVTVERQ